MERKTHKKKNHKSHDLQTTEGYTGFEINSAEKYKIKQKIDLNTDRVTSENNLVQIKKKKHKKDKMHDGSLMEQSISFDNSEGSFKKKKHKKKDEAEYDSDPKHEIIPFKNSNISLSDLNIHQMSAENNSFEKKNKHNIKAYDVPISEQTAAFDSEITSVYKHKKKKEKHDLHGTGEKMYKLHTSESYFDTGAEIPSHKKKHKKKDKMYELHTDEGCTATGTEFTHVKKDGIKQKINDFNNSHESSEINATRENKNKVYNESNTEQNIIFKNLEKSINKHKKIKEIHDLHRPEDSADPNFGINYMKAHKINCSNLNNIDQLSLGVNLTDENKKKHKKITACNDSITEQQAAFDDSEISYKHKKKKEKCDLHGTGKKMHKLYTGESYFDTGTEIRFHKEKQKKDKMHELDIDEGYTGTKIISLKKHGVKRKISDLNNFSHESSEINATHKNKNKVYNKSYTEQNISFSNLEKSINKHKKTKEIHDLHRSEDFTDPNFGINCMKAHKINCSNLNNIDQLSLGVNLFNENKKKHKKITACNDSITEQHAAFGDSGIISVHKHKKRKHGERKEMNDVPVIEKYAENGSVEESSKLNPNLNLGLPNNSQVNSVYKNKSKHKSKKVCSDLDICEGNYAFNDSTLGPTEGISCFNNTKNISKGKYDNIIEVHNKSKHSDLENHSKKETKKRDKSYIKSSDKNNETNECQLLTESVRRGDESNQKFISDIQTELAENSERNSDFLQIPYKRMFDFFSNVNEDPVNFNVPQLHVTESVHDLKEEEKIHLQHDGVFIKTGKFTKEEDIIIKKNFENFCNRYGVSDFFSLFGIGRYKTDADILRFIKAKHFYVRLGKNLNNRTLHSIYKRARKILHPSKNENSFNKSEITKLKKLHATVYNKWNYIGEALGKTGESCLEAYRWHEKEISKGAWTEEEQKQLIESIKKVTGSSDLSCDAIQNISWLEVSTHVPTRNSSQCRQYWAQHLAWKSESVRKKWNKNCYVKLISILWKDWDVENTSEIDWSKIHKSFVDVAASYVYIQKRWYFLKSQVPGYKNKNYKEIIKFLCQKYNVDA